MAYWWVFQGQTYREESTGQYLWAPGPDSQNQFYWASLDDVRAGDIIFSYADMYIKAVVTARGSAEIAERPEGYKIEAWEGAGRRIQAEYQLLERPIDLNDIPIETRQLLNVFHGPLNKKLTGNQGYLYPVSDAAAHGLLATIDQANPTTVDNVVLKAAPTTTEREQLAKARIGQGQFRDDLLNYWQRSCAVSGLTVVRLLRASHIKAWRDSNNVERLDPFNGILLGPAYDAAFDCGLISFRNDGLIMVSNDLERADFERLGLNADARLSRVSDKHFEYLNHHRTQYAF